MLKDYIKRKEKKKRSGDGRKFKGERKIYI